MTLDYPNLLVWLEDLALGLTLGFQFGFLASNHLIAAASKFVEWNWHAGLIAEDVRCWISAVGEEVCKDNENTWSGQMLIFTHNGQE